MSLKVALPYPVIGVKLAGITESSAVDELPLLDQEALNDLDEDEVNDHIQMLQNRIQALETSLQKARQEAFQSGFEEGQKAVESKYQEALEKLPAEFGRSISSLQQQFEESIRKAEQPLMELSLLIVDKILKYHLELSSNQKELLFRQLSHFLENLQEQQDITIHLAPSQYAFIRHENFIKNYQGKIHFVEDAQLKPGECLLETAEFIIDGTIKGQLEQIARQVIKESN